MTSRLAALGLPAAAVAVLGFRSGGYFPSEWGLLLGGVAVLGLVLLLLVEGVDLRRRDVVFVAALVAFAGWSLASLAWSSGPDGPVLAAERTSIYAGAALVLLLAVSLGRVRWLLAGVGIGAVVVCTWGLVTRLFPAGPVVADPVAGARLTAPIGYANALGALAVLATLLLLGFALDEHAAWRAAAGAALVPLAATLYLTLSRGSLVALAAGLVLAVAADGTGRLVGALVVLTPAPAAGVLLAAASPLDGALPHERAASAGHRLALELALLALAGAAAGLVGAPVARRLAPLGWLAIAAAAAVAAAGVVRVGPGELAHRAVASFRTPLSAEGAPTRRLLSVSPSGRSAYWRVAWRMVEREPVLGEGAGSFERWWLQDRPVANDARNAHNLYLETLAELGPVGLGLLLLALAVPLLGPWRREPLAVGALAAYGAWLVHALLDWDWQIPGVTLPALACGAALVVLARVEDRPAALGRVPRGLGVAGAVACVGVALAVHVGNRAADTAQGALDAGRPASAAADARRAETWMPWSADATRLLGEAELAQRRDAQARHSLRRALSRDAESWQAWYDLALVTDGPPHRRALARARRLNPLAPELAGLR